MRKLLITLLSMFTVTNALEVKVASVEFNPKFMQLDSNINGIVDAVINAAQNNAKLIVLPEAATTGYIYKDRQQLAPYLDTIPGKTTDAIAKVTNKYHTYVAIGIIEKDSATGIVYNSAALIGPNGYIGKYRKNQLNPSDNMWSSRGNLTFPVFDTEIGKIALLICYDDTHLQSLLIPNLRGADILAYITSSDILPKFEKGSNTNHSTIGNISSISGWVGINVVASNRTGNEINPLTGAITHFVGGASIWDNNGNLLNSASVSTWTNPGQPQTIYATLDTNKPNIQKEFWLKHRRPDLYQDYNYYRAPIDPSANKIPHQISSLLIQYQPDNDKLDDNYSKIINLIQKNQEVFNLVVLPFNSLIGNVIITKENINKYAEELHGKSYNLAMNLAKQYKTYLLFSMPEQYNGKYYETAILFDYNGNQVGIYRKSHLNDTEQTWATSGNDLPVFNTDLGRVAIMLNDEARIPEIADIYSLRRADLILIPTMYNQTEYGGKVNIPAGIVPNSSDRGMFVWYDIAKYAQAYTLVANYINGSHHDVGQSAVYSLVPEDGYYAPSISPNVENAFLVNFTTHANDTLWQNQQNLITGRRSDLAIPLTLDMQSKCFKEWLLNSSSKELCVD
ncbi:MAG: carbon-nitrogen hydrolase family protein [Proteobacteria bacterium]|nr:MAG: carbon-nitrogen hydrolase family protein [Pseudomonadota bacterium]